MHLKRLPVFGLLLATSLAPALARKKKVSPAPVPPAIEQMTPDEKVLHALNRLEFGPRPGDVDRVRETGLAAFIDQQLHPASIPQGAELEAKLEPLDTLRMSSMEMAHKYPPNFLVKQMVDGKLPWPDDPETRIVLRRVAEKYRDKLGLPNDAPPLTFDQVIAPLPAAQRVAFESGLPGEKVALLESLPLQLQFDILTTMKPGQRQMIYAAAPVAYRRRMLTFAGTQQLVNQDLSEGKILRAVYSNRQLEEVLTDFWYNHFNVFLDKGGDRYFVTAYERDAIRPFVLGKFEDLLTATAKSPAMLFYLDNFQSVRADPGSPDANPKRAKRGLNENYGRELMELHTLGVDGGYTQKDVTEVARCFTGWSIEEPRRGGAFTFNARQHDNGEKHVLGVTIRAGGGIEDGYKVISILAHHPSTARFISRALAVRFQSDNPPQTLVDRMAATFTASDGDLREVMKTMLQSPEFWAKDAFRSKIKSPFEMVVSALRATGADVDFTNALVNQLNQLGEPLYRKQEPTGYSNQGAEWMNSAALLGRMNFALNLTANKVPGVKSALPSTADPDIMAQVLMGTHLTADSRQIVSKALAEKSAASETPSPSSPPPTALVAGLTLGSPDFQRR